MKHVQWSIKLFKKEEEEEKKYSTPHLRQGHMLAVYVKHSFTHTLESAFPRTLVLKPKNYFAVRGQTAAGRRYESKAITFFVKENKENQHDL